MDKNSAKFFAAELGAKIPTLDLHGYFPDQAIEKLDIFIFQCIEQSTQSARIIYGGGTGRLREKVLNCLKDQKVVVDYQEEAGSCVVLF